MGDVIQPQVCPAVALAHPQQFAGIIQPLAPGLGHVIDESPAALLHHDPHRAVGRIDREDSVKLVSALVIVEIKFVAAR